MLTIDREELLPSIQKLKETGYNYLVKITAIDLNDHLDILYFLRNIHEEKDEMLRVSLASQDAWIPTVIGEFKASDWYERELAEMFGIDVRGRNTERLLLEKWDGVDAPLRKYFEWNKPYVSSD